MDASARVNETRGLIRVAPWSLGYFPFAAVAFLYEVSKSRPHWGVLGGLILISVIASIGELRKLRWLKPGTNSEKLAVLLTVGSGVLCAVFIVGVAYFFGPAYAVHLTALYVISTSSVLALLFGIAAVLAERKGQVRVYVGNKGWVYLPRTPPSNSTPHASRMKRFIAFSFVFLFGVVIGVLIGARVGLWEFMLADAQYKASILSTEIKAIKAGKTDRVVEGMEISLNAELAKHGEYMESYLWWLWPELRSSDDQPIRHAVAYRLSNPYEGPDLSKPESWNPDVDMQGEFVQGVIAGQRAQQVYIRSVLQHYGMPSSSLQPTPNASASERAR